MVSERKENKKKASLVDIIISVRHMVTDSVHNVRKHDTTMTKAIIYLYIYLFISY